MLTLKCDYVKNTTSDMATFPGGVSHGLTMVNVWNLKYLALLVLKTAQNLENKAVSGS